MNIGNAGKACGLPLKTIRYYEEIGLIKPARRENGYRDYSENDICKLRFIQRARRLGFTIEDCRTLLSLYEDDSRASKDVKAIAKKHLEEIESKIVELQSIHSALSHLVNECHGDHRPDCPILDDLSGGSASEKEKQS